MDNLLTPHHNSQLGRTQTAVNNLFTDALHLHIADAVAELSQNSRVTYTTSLEKLREWLESRHLTPQNARQWLAELSTQFAPSTVNTRRAAIVSLVSWVKGRLMEGVAETAEMSRVRGEALIQCDAFFALRSKKVVGQKVGQWLSAGEARVLVDTLDGEYKTAVQIMLGTGLRVSEVTALVFTTDGKPNEIVERDGRKVLVIHGKGGKTRNVPAPRWLEPVLTDFAGVGLKANTISKRISRVSEDVLGKKITAHDLRRTFARMVFKSAPERLVELSAILGHSTLEMTLKYVNAELETERPCTDLIEF